MPYCAACAAMSFKAARYVRLYTPFSGSAPAHMTPSRITFTPRLFRKIKSSATSDVLASNLSVDGIQGGPLTTTLIPWKMRSLPCSSTNLRKPLTPPSLDSDMDCNFPIGAPCCSGPGFVAPLSYRKFLDFVRSEGPSFVCKGRGTAETIVSAARHRSTHEKAIVIPTFPALLTRNVHPSLTANNLRPDSESEDSESGCFGTD
jgi:hypothetical protein